MANVLITGGAGFIGSHLTESLLARGDRVVILDDESTGTQGNLSHFASNRALTFIGGSASNRQLLGKLLREHEIETVFHLAASVGVQLIASNPIRTIENNVYTTELLLQELRDEQNRRGSPIKLYFASTSEVYGKNPKARWCEEDDLVFGPTVRPRWSYGVSKAIDEFLVLAYHREFQMPAVIGRFFNVVGPRQTGRFGMVLPRFVDAASQGKPLKVHGDGKQIRCFAHVSDVVRGVIALMDTPAAIGQVFNIGSDQPISIMELARRVASHFSPPSTIELQSYTEAYSEDFEDVQSRIPDLTKIRKLIGYQSHYDLDRIIADVIASRPR